MWTTIEGGGCWVVPKVVVVEGLSMEYEYVVGWESKGGEELRKTTLR